MSDILILFLLFLGLDLLFTAVRAALVHTRLPNLMGMQAEYPEEVDQTIVLLEEPRMRVTLRMAAVLFHFILAGLATLLLFEFNLLVWIGWGVILLLGAALVINTFEYAIEGAVLHRSEIWALRFTWLGRLLDFILRPFTLLLIRLIGSTNSLQRQLSAVTDDELKNWVETGQPEGSLEKRERKMIYSIFQFGETLCREIMVPRIDVFGLDISTSLPEAIDAITRSGHSRIPVYAEDIDNILGILYAKDLLRTPQGSSAPDRLRKLLRQAYFVPEAKKVDELLREMQGRGVHMAIVVDEYGGTAGIITLEDIVEEIVGEIRDEYDQAEEQMFQAISPDEYKLQGRIHLDEVNELLGTHLPKEDAETLGGYIYGEVGKIPTGGEKLTVEDWILMVEQVSGRRIRIVHAHRKPDKLPEEEQTDDVERRDQSNSD